MLSLRLQSRMVGRTRCTTNGVLYTPAGVVLDETRFMVSSFTDATSSGHKNDDRREYSQTRPCHLAAVATDQGIAAAASSTPPSFHVSKSEFGSFAPSPSPPPITKAVASPSPGENGKLPKNIRQIIEISRRKNLRARPERSGMEHVEESAISWLTEIYQAAEVGDAAKAANLLQEMIDEHEATQDHSIRPDWAAFNGVLRAYEKSEDPNDEALQKAEEVLSRMKQYSLPPYNWNTEPSDHSYCSLLVLLENRMDIKDIYVRSHRENEFTKRADEIHAEVMSSYHQRKKRGDKGHLLTRQYYSRLMQLNARLGRAEKVEALLEEMYRDFTNGNKRNKPNSYHTSLVLKAWAKSRSRNAPQRVETLMKWKWERANEGELDLKPTKYSYAIAIECWSRSYAPNAKERAESLFREMLQHYSDQGDEMLKPDSRIYGAVMLAYAKRGDYEKTIELFEEMKEQYFRHGNEQCKPNHANYEMCFDALAKSKLPSALEDGEALLMEMWENYDSGSKCDSISSIKPTYNMYASVMDGWAKSKLPSAATRVEVLFRELQRRWREADDDGLLMSTNTKSFAILSAYAQIGQHLKVESLINEMISEDPIRKKTFAEPTSKLFDNLLFAYAKCVPAKPMEAEKVLKSMWEMYHESGKAHMKPTTYSYINMIYCWSNCDQPDRAEATLRNLIGIWEDTKDDLLHPNNVAYQACMHAYARTGNAKKAESLLSELNESFQTSGNRSLKPTTTAFNVVLNAWAKSHSEEAPERCEAIVSNMEDLSNTKQLPVWPDQFTYSSLMNSWANSHREDAPEQAVRLLQQLKDKYNAGVTQSKPDFRIYTSAIAAITRSQPTLGLQETIRMLELFDEMLENGDDRVAPTIITYNHVLSGILKSQISNEEKAVYADRISNLMKEHGVSPGRNARDILSKLRLDI